MVATGGMDGRVRVWRRVKSRRGSREAVRDGSGNEAGDRDRVAEWKDWEFLTSLETGSEIQVSCSFALVEEGEVADQCSGSLGTRRVMCSRRDVRIRQSGFGNVSDFTILACTLGNYTLRPFVDGIGGTPLQDSRPLKDSYGSQSRLVLEHRCRRAALTKSVPSGNTLTVLSSHTLPSTAGLFPPPQGKNLLTTSLDSSLILWEISSSTPIFKTSIFVSPNSPNFDPELHGITAVAVSPNGQLAAVGGANGMVRLVSLPKGDVVGKLDGHKEGESVEALVFVDLLGGAGGGGKGVVVVSGGTDGKGFVWDVATGRVRAELQHSVSLFSSFRLLNLYPLLQSPLPQATPRHGL